jgi:hypothetical protein
MNTLAYWYASLGVVALLVASTEATAQSIRDDGWSFAFTAPSGWQVVDKGAEGAQLVSADQSAYLLVEPHQLTTQDGLAQAAGEGYADAGVRLAPVGQVSPYGDGIAVEMQGVIEGQPARAYGIGVISPADRRRPGPARAAASVGGWDHASAV